MSLSRETLPAHQDLLNPFDLYEHAQQMLWDGKYREALSLAGVLLSLPDNPLEVDVHFMRGTLCRILHQFPESLESLTVVIDRYDELYYLGKSTPLSEFYCQRALTFLLLHQYESAVWDCTEAIRLDISSSVAFRDRGIAFLQLEQFEDAELDLTESIRLDPMTVCTYLYRGNVFHNTLRYDEAISDYEMALKLDPENGEAFQQRARSMEMKSRVLGRPSSEKGRTFVEAIVAEYRRRRKDGHSKGMSWGGVAVKGYISVRGQFLTLLGAANRALEIVGADLNSPSFDFPASYSAPLIAYLRFQVDALVSMWTMNDEIARMPNCSLRALQYSDQAKAFGQVISVKKRLQQLSPVDVSQQLPEGLLVAYHLIQDCPLCQDTLVRWVVRDGEIAHQDTLDLSDLLHGTSLSESVDFFPSLVGEASRLPHSDKVLSRSSSDEQIRVCRLLQSLLLEELTDHLLPKSRHVTFVPDRSLFLIPFGCLVNSSGKFLIEERSHSVSTSLRMISLNAELLESALMRRMSEDDGRKRVCGLFCGSPTSSDSQSPLSGTERMGKLDGSVQERQSVVSSMSRLQYESEDVGCVALVGSQLTAIRLEHCCQFLSPRFLHVAAHSSPSVADHSVDDEHPFPEYAMTGGIQFSGTSILYSTTVAEFDLGGTQLVFLNSCGLADGSLQDIGMMGFYRACFLAGCPSVICALWKVFDHLGKIVGSGFYRELGKGCDKAEALRTSLLAAMRFQIGPFESSSVGRVRNFPVLWAAYQLFGNRL